MTDTTLLVGSAPSPGRRPRGARVGRGILLGLAVASILLQSSVLAGAGWAAANPRLVSDTWTVWNYEPPNVIAEYAERAGMSEQGRFVFYASLPEVVAAEDFDGHCSRDEPGIGVLGCFTLSDARIFLYDITNEELEDYEVVVAAHEMLHAAWDRLSAEQKAALVEPLERAFSELGPEHELVERLASYERFDPSSRIPELYAIIGTEIAVVPAELEEHYAEYFDDRGIVVSLWQGVSAIFAELKSELDRLSAELDRLHAEIDSEQTATAAAAAELEADITAFNERAARPGGYTTAAFERDRAALIARQDELSARIAATNAKIDEYNALVAEFTELNEQAAGLNRDLNIDPQPMETSEGRETP